MEKKDNIFAGNAGVTPFEFNETVASVFDDMITRSVPLYREIILQQARLAAKFYRSGTQIYDLGCSTGNFAAALFHEMKGVKLALTAIDNSSPMIELFKKRLAAFGGAGSINPVVSDIMNINFTPASVIISNLTVQFISPDKRDLLIKRIYDALVPGGIFLLTEKTINPDEDFAALQQEFYYRLKEENGYSQIEITRKREALENVLIPETVEAHITRLNTAGFNAIEIWLKWFHFTSFICRKD